jgi:hypothetical protein
MDERGMHRALLMVQPHPKIQRINNIKIVKQENNNNLFGVPMTQLRDIISIPTSYEEAYYNPNSWIQLKWREAIALELSKMQQLKVWHPVTKASIPPNQKLIKNKWVFDIKRSGVFRARLVTCGYSQIPGVDFQEYYSSRTSDSDR